MAQLVVPALAHRELDGESLRRQGLHAGTVDYMFRSE